MSRMVALVCPFVCVCAAVFQPKDAAFNAVCGASQSLRPTNTCLWKGQDPAESRTFLMAGVGKQSYRQWRPMTQHGSVYEEVTK
jgi:hypothetical protein